MDARDSGTRRRKILAENEKSLVEFSFWTWSELLIALKQCQDLLPTKNSSVITKSVLDCLVGKLVLPSSPSPYASSFRERSSFQFYGDTRSSNDRLRKKCSQTTWWFEDLVFLNSNFVEKVIRTMVSEEFDHAIVFKFLLYYWKSKVFGTTLAEKREITELVIILICLLDGTSLSFKGLFSIYQAAFRLKVSKRLRNMLENLISSQLDRATIDYLLVPSLREKSYTYDVNMVLKFVKAFLLEDGIRLVPSRLNKVGTLMDLYLVEVAPDCHLKLSKFSELAMILPDCARESHDKLYQAMDMYFQVHSELYEVEKMRVCMALNYEKLSAEALRHLARNSKFPSRVSVKAFMLQNSKLTSLIREIYHLKTSKDPWISDASEEIIKSVKEEDKHMLNKAKKLIGADCQGMPLKEVELQKVCGGVQSQPTASSTNAATCAPILRGSLHQH
ncbi:NPH3 domain containing protein [Trema orientale]|uniref:NPH3 domain containing protein n=1 Tax=Trema orientale TaxID=63057 RepID=A0A2P5CV21_TREOI|nr:NPH3 domain containing protein [Trema orientale]